MSQKKNTTQAYEATMDYLYSQLPMFQRLGKTAFKKDLTNILALTEALDNPHRKFKSIHLAGTNGKGSTAFLLAAALQAQGLKVGLYVSPHYKDFRERIRINGELCSKEFVVDFTAKNKALYAQIAPSFFEITVAMAFAYFAQEEVDIAIIETGLGGRLDSTNIINPMLSIITNIGLDHTDMLGDTLPLIAAEKAGIIKTKTMVVIGKDQAETRPVFEAKAQQEDAPIIFADKQFVVQEIQADLTHTDFEVTTLSTQQTTILKVNIHGPFQAENLKTALTALATLKANDLLPIDEQKTHNGWLNLKQLTGYMGRWQIINDQPLAICDSAHNAEGLQPVLERLTSMDYTQLHFIFGMVSDKNPEKVLKLLPKSAQYYFAKANIPRGLDAATLQEKAAAFDLNGQAYESVAMAYTTALSNAQADDLVYVGGSIFVVAEVL